MENSSKPKVLIALMTGGKDPVWQLQSSVNSFRDDPRVDAKVAYFTKRPDEANRNFAAKTTRESFDFMVMLDPDTVPKANPIDLVMLDLDIVGMAYPQWNISDPNYPVYFLGMDKAEDGYTEHKERTGLQEVDAVGSGALVVAKRVFEKIHDPFLRVWNEDGDAILGIDFNFCERAKQEGFKVHCHYDYLADHLKEVSLLDVLNFKHGI